MISNRLLSEAPSTVSFTRGFDPSDQDLVEFLQCLFSRPFIMYACLFFAGPRALKHAMSRFGFTNFQSLHYSDKNNPHPLSDEALTSSLSRYSNVEINFQASGGNHSLNYNFRAGVRPQHQITFNIQLPNSGVIVGRACRLPGLRFTDSFRFNPQNIFNFYTMFTYLVYFAEQVNSTDVDQSDNFGDAAFCLPPGSMNFKDSPVFLNLFSDALNKKTHNTNPVYGRRYDFAYADYLTGNPKRDHGNFVWNQTSNCQLQTTLPNIPIGAPTTPQAVGNGNNTVDSPNYANFLMRFGLLINTDDQSVFNPPGNSGLVFIYYNLNAPSRSPTIGIEVDRFFKKIDLQFPQLETSSDPEGKIPQTLFSHVSPIRPGYALFNNKNILRKDGTYSRFVPDGVTPIYFSPNTNVFNLPATANSNQSRFQYTSATFSCVFLYLFLDDFASGNLQLPSFTGFTKMPLALNPINEVQTQNWILSWEIIYNQWRNCRSALSVRLHSDQLFQFKR